MEERPLLAPDSTDTGGTSQSTVPPWENLVMSQVPYVERSLTPPTSHNEPTPRPRQRTLASDHQSQTKPKLFTANSAPQESGYISPTSQEAVHSRWSRRRHTSAFQIPPPPAPAPYETSLDVPAKRTLSHPIPYVAHPPPSPPKSPSSSTNSSETSPPQEPAKGLPGTMSSRASRMQVDTKSRPKPQDQPSSPRSENEHRPMSKRFTAVFRDIFRKEPIDESGLERISDRHWTDEY
jgi:hypothetical protein